MPRTLFTREEILAEVARQEREALLARYAASETPPETVETTGNVVPLRRPA